MSSFDGNKPKMSSPSCLPGFNALGVLDSVDPVVFNGHDNAEQEVCDFILTLAFVYNNFKDLLWAYVCLRNLSPKSFELSPQYGQLQGMIGHVTRAMYALIHELTRLIQENPKPQEHNEFKKTIIALNPDTRRRWEELTRFANGSEATDPLLKTVALIRHNLASHYFGLDFLSKGYKRFFAAPGPGRDAAYVSRGNTMDAVRFYFADAASQGGFEHAISGKTKEEISDRLSEFCRAINLAVYDIVVKFMERRGKGWYRLSGDRKRQGF